MRATGCAVVLFGGLAACSGSPNAEDVCEIDDIAVGRATGFIDDTPWEPAGVTWTTAGTAIQLNAPPNNGWQLSLVAQTDRDGNPVADEVSAGNFPVHVTLAAGGEGGFATLYPSSGSSFNTGLAEGGHLQILRLDADRGLVGCFSFEAASEDGAVATLSDGQVRATPM